jgi:hypothetical protein
MCMRLNSEPLEHAYRRLELVFLEHNALNRYIDSIQINHLYLLFVKYHT